MAKLSGGGLTSNKLVRPGVKAGPPNTRVVNVGGVSQLGAVQGGRMRDGGHTDKSVAKPLFDGRASQVPLGNQLATNVGQGGPGTGRTVIRSGGQGVHGLVAGQREPWGRDVWADYPGSQGAPTVGDRRR
jgi:hypothetical protein